VYIRDVTKDISWIYRQVPTILFERQFTILIDGELDSMAVLETQYRIFGLGLLYPTKMKGLNGKIGFL